MNRRPWLLVDPGTLQREELHTLDAEESRHLLKVLRAGIGDQIVLADGRGLTAPAVIREIGRTRLRVGVEEIRHHPRSEGIEFFPGLLHTRAMDWLIQKSVELGVLRLCPLITRRSQAGKKVAHRLEHWRRVARQSLKQCHRPWEMEISEALSLEDLLQTAGEPGFLADPEGLPIDSCREGPASRLIVGPEGGLEEREKNQLLAAGWMQLRLGRNILRAETAGMAAIVLISEHSGAVEGKGQEQDA